MDPPDSFLHLESLSRFSFLQLFGLWKENPPRYLQDPRYLPEVSYWNCQDYANACHLETSAKWLSWQRNNVTISYIAMKIHFYKTPEGKYFCVTWIFGEYFIAITNVFPCRATGREWLSYNYNRRQHGMTPCCTRLHTVAWYCTVKNSCCFILWSDSSSAYGSWTSTGHRVLIYNVYRQKKDDDNHFNDDNDHYKIDQNNI